MGKNELTELEYDKLKDEQLARIGYRDNMIYLTLIAIGAVFSFAITDNSHYPALLVLPLVNFILGWTYIINDEKVSAIGRYIRKELSVRVNSSSTEDGDVFGWEFAHRSDPHRKQRKFIQCVVDILTFPFSGLLSIFIYFYLADVVSAIVEIVSLFEIILLGLLSWQFIQYADFGVGHEN